MSNEEMTHNELGSMIDAVYNVRALRLEKAKEVDALKAEETALKLRIREVLETYGLQKASGGVATAGLTHKIEPAVQDWDELYKYVQTNDRFDLLQKRVSVLAWRELYEGGTTVPGTEPVDVYDISLTKSTR